MNQANRALRISFHLFLSLSVILSQTISHDGNAYATDTTTHTSAVTDTPPEQTQPASGPPESQRQFIMEIGPHDAYPSVRIVDPKPAEKTFVPGRLIVKLKHIPDPAAAQTQLQEFQARQAQLGASGTRLLYESLVPVWQNDVKLVVKPVTNVDQEPQRGWFEQLRMTTLDGGTPIDQPAAEQQLVERRHAASAALETFCFQDELVVTFPDNTDILAMAEEVSNDPAVKEVHPDYIVKTQWVPNDPYYSSSGAWGQAFRDLWGLVKMSMEQAWDLSKGAGVIVAVSDTGVDYTHPDIAANMWRNPGEVAGNGVDDDQNGYVDDVYGYDFVNSDGNPRDDHGHGTHCAGTIAAVGNNSTGIVGVAPEARIMAVKGLSANGSGSISGLASGIVYAATMGAKVINASWGPSLPSAAASALTNAVSFAHDTKDVVFVAAAGNSNADVGHESMGYAPASLRDAIAISAYDSTDTKASFSNYGLKIDNAAPGGGDTQPVSAYQPARSILSLLSSIVDPGMTGNGQLVIGGQYLRQAGTSMAAPHAAGLAALIRSKYSALSAEQVRQAMRRGSDDVGPIGFDFQSGFGRLNAFKALSTEGAPLAARIMQPTGGLYQGASSVNITGTVGGPGFWQWTLKYAPGGATAIPAGGWTTIATGTNQVTEATLASWNIQNVPDGLVTICLSAQKTTGETYNDYTQISIGQVFITSPPPDDITIFRIGDLIDLSGTVNPSGFVRYVIKIIKRDGTELGGANVSLTNGGNLPVLGGKLGTWNTAGVAQDHYTMRLEVTTSGSSTPIVKNAMVIVADSTLRAGWPISLPPMLRAQSKQQIQADVTGDGKQEIVIAMGRQGVLQVHVIDPLTGLNLPGWPKSVEGGGGDNVWCSPPAVGDLDRDGKAEIVIGNVYTGKLFVWKFDGTNLPGWPKSFPLPNGYWGYHDIVVADVNNDGYNDIVDLRHQGTVGRLDVIGRDGNYLAGWPQSIPNSASGNYCRPPAVGDVEGDGPKEILVSVDGAPAPVYLFRSNGTLMPGWPQNLLPPPPPPGVFWIDHAAVEPIMADIDGNGDLELITGTLRNQPGTGWNYSEFTVFNHNGTLFPGWPKTVNGWAEMSMAAGDLDGDGKPEIVGTSASLEIVSGVWCAVINVHGFKQNGAYAAGWPVKFAWPSNFLSNGRGSTVIVADINNDGKQDVVVPHSFVDIDRQPYIYGVLGNGTPAPGFPKPVASTMFYNTFSAAVGNMVGNNLQLSYSDMGKGGYTSPDFRERLYTWDLSAPASAKLDWPMTRGNPAHTAALIPPPVPPQPPTNLTATAVSSSQINLAWTDNSGNESGFKIERSPTGATGSFSQIDTVGPNVTAYNNTGLAASTTYYYRVRAYNDGGDSAYSNIANATTFPLPPAAPTNLTATAVSSSQINLAWTDNSLNETGFRIERSLTGATGSFSQIATVGANVTAYNNTGLAASTTYYYRVCAYHSVSGDSAWSNMADATTFATPPAAPTDLTATAISQTQINLAWTDNASNESGFKIERSPTGASGSFTQIATVGANVTSYSNTGLTAATTYYYRVCAYNTGGDSAYSNIASATTLPNPPSAPSNLTATAVSSSRIDLAWTDNADNESGFKIERSLTGAAGSFSQIATVGANVTSYSNTGLAASTTYYYRVRAYNTGGDSAYSNIASATTFATPPAAPTNLTATAVSQTQINLAWTDNANNETGFKIERSPTGATGSFTQIATVGANVTSYSNTGLSSNTTYYYRVCATNSAGDSAYSNTASATTFADPPDAPTDLTATAISSSRIDLAWTDNADNESGFKIERSLTGAAGSFSQIATVGANVTSYSNTGLAASTTYYYQVRAYNSGGNSAYSNIANATTPAAPPAAPTGLSATAISQTQINLAWTDNSGNETGFKIERSLTGASGSFTQIATVGANVTAYSDTGLTAATTYYYRVRAYNTGGDSAYSNVASATTLPDPPAAPTDLTATAISSSQIRLNWTDNANNESGFKIERSLTGAAGSFSQIATVGANVTTYTNAGLAASTTYHYRVRAYNAGGDSGYSNIANATTFPPPPVAPSNLMAMAVSTSQINLYWTDNSNNEDGFKIERSLTGTSGSFSEIATVGADVTTYSDTGLAAGTTYYYRVRAYNSGGNSAYSNTADATTFQGPPAAPVELVATAVSSSQINLSWVDRSNNEAGFRIERAMFSEGPFMPIATVGANVTTYSDTGLAAGTTYYYQVCAYNSAGDSDYSNIASATTQSGPTPPAAPTNLTATAVSSSQINLRWADNSDNESGFRIERALSLTGPFFLIATVGPNVTAYNNTGLAAGTTYYYRVRAYNAAGNSAYSNTASATTFQGPPSAPTRLIATAVSSSQINLRWTDTSNNEDGFGIERALSFSGPFTQIASVGANVTTYSDTGLAPGTRYFYRVRAFNAFGNSAYSNIASATTFQSPPAAPVELVATAVSSSQINLRWVDRSNNESGFRIERAMFSEGPFMPIATVGANVTTYSDTGLAAGTTYYYRVCAFNSAGDSGYSNTAKATTFGGEIPEAPSYLTAMAISSSAIDLHWQDNSDNEDGFSIERSMSPAGPFMPIATVGANVTFYRDTGLAPGTTYYYRVRAFNSAGSSYYSNVAEATTFSGVPAAPGKLTAIAVSSSQIDLRWLDMSDNEEGFVIERSMFSPVGPFMPIATVGENVTFYQDTGLNPDTTYYYRVYAYNSAGNSPYSNIAFATTFPGSGLAAPTNLVARAFSSTQIQLRWQDNSDNEDGFVIERTTNPRLPFMPIATVGANATFFMDRGLAPRTVYYYRVRAYNAYGSSDYSNVAEARTY